MWGCHEVLLTPAYWAVQSWLHRVSSSHGTHTLRQGKSLAEEIAACILGGYGIKSELGQAAFKRLRDAGLLDDPEVSSSSIEKVLRQPLDVHGHSVRYPFATSKARFLVATLRQLPSKCLPAVPDRAFRDALTALPGIGLKTASWITRNWLNSDEVAVLDIHIVRAGILLGIFTKDDQLPRDYRSMESRFILLARGLGVPVPILDLVMWSQMRKMPSLVSLLLRSGAAPPLEILSPAQSHA